jgi:glycosyltransferase involved in cell wall biosynthesis
LSGFDALIAYSRTGADQFTSAGFPRERIFLAPNAATPRPSAPPIEKPAHFPTGRPVVLFVGRLQERKRVDALLRVCAQLPEGLRPRVLIVGDGPAREAFQTAARKYYPSAEFLGARHDEALEPYYAAADLFILPGTGGLAVQQAMRYGLPVIVAEADGTQADLVRPENGWMLPPNDDAALQSALIEALSDPARLRQMGQASYRIVAEEVNLERMVQVFAQAVDSVTSRPKSRALSVE